MENMVGEEAIRSLIHSIWLSFPWTCGTTHCLGGTALFSFAREAVFSWFLRSIDLVMTSNSHCFSFSFLKIVDKQNTMRVSKYGCHNLVSPLFYLFVTYRRKKSFLPCLNSSKQHSESSTRCCFWLGVSKRGIHVKNNSRILKDSCKIVNALPSDIFKVSAISRNFNLRSPKTILWTFVTFFGKTADFGRPERSGIVHNTT